MTARPAAFPDYDTGLVNVLPNVPNAFQTLGHSNKDRLSAPELNTLMNRQGLWKRYLDESRRTTLDKFAKDWDIIGAGVSSWNVGCWCPGLGKFIFFNNSGNTSANTVYTYDGNNLVAGGFIAASTALIGGVAWSPSLAKAVAVTRNTSATTGTLQSSTDGSSWTNVITAPTAGSVALWNGITWSPALGLFCAVGAGGGAGVQVMTSPDGTTWTSRTAAAAQTWQCVTWSPALGIFCALSANGTQHSMTSSDGINWSLGATSAPGAAGSTPSALAWSPELGIFCAGGKTSTDGVNWTTQTVGTMIGVCWASELSLFIAIGSGSFGSYLMTSPDGVNWTNRPKIGANFFPGQNGGSPIWSPELGMCLMGTNITSGSSASLMRSR